MNWARRLADRKKTSLFRQRRELASPQDIHVQVDDQEFLSFCSNDYLGLANDQRVIKALKQGADRWGVGAGASHLITGHTQVHSQLEEALAEFVGAERALLFSTGYMANLAIATTLADRGTHLFEDKLNHASLIDAVRLSRAKSRRYAHGDTNRLQQMMSATDGEKLILTDAVFSMDGDLAPILDLVSLAETQNALLIADDAHGLGVLGESGAGTLEHFDISLSRPVLLMATLGKAMGVFGAFVAGREDIIDALIQEARTYSYTTAPPPALAQATLASLEIVRQEPEHRLRLQEHIRYFRQQAETLGLKVMDSPTPIQPLVLGQAETALSVSEKLRQKGLLVPAIRPPTVPEGSARLRVSLCAKHSRDHLDQLLEALAWATREQ